MSKISEAFRDRKAFVAYLMAGDPAPDKTGEFIRALEKAGADIIEIGIPFSDPIAEGEVIQAANLRALASGATLDGVFGTLRSLKGEISVPLAFMTYLNPILQYGYDAFFARCADCGVSGVIIPDLPLEERDEVAGFTAVHGVDLIPLIAPTSAERVARIARAAEGYVYLVSSLGVTGARRAITGDIPRLVANIRAYTDIPVAVGFGVHRPEQAAELSRDADGVIVGSAIVSIIAEYGRDAAPLLESYVRRMKAAMRSE
ncbi:MAG: tryptophan synthase subunit alpha [Clostridiales Family XIII bacterium]|jgi:tryptophan synthase alpha chain|nr:tryptophan synthase subunit alpha [Clostridiales Family XIII bacterium]